MKTDFGEEFIEYNICPPGTLVQIDNKIGVYLCSALTRGYLTGGSNIIYINGDIRWYSRHQLLIEITGK